MSKKLWLPHWVAIRGATYSDADLVNHFGLSHYRRADRVPLDREYVVLVDHGGWTVVADGLFYVLCNLPTTRPAIGLLGQAHEVFVSYLADCDDDFAFDYYKEGRVARRYSVVGGRNDGPVILDDFGDPLAGEPDASALPFSLDARLWVAAALGIKTEYTEQEVRVYAPIEKIRLAAK